MKTALITTTINIPSVLALYRRFDPSASVRFFVAVDTNTPVAASQFCENLGNCEVVGHTTYKCDEIIGLKSIQRRNLALLRALEWGADIVISVDDDNVCIDPNYFRQFEHVLGQPFSGLSTLNTWKQNDVWFDVGDLLFDNTYSPAPHRGFPDTVLKSNWTHVVDAKVGVAAGICLGDPDISAHHRMANRPEVHTVSEMLKAGVVVSPDVKTVFNSQNTAIIRELAPAWSMWCGVQRYDDILASLMVQKVMRSRGYYAHFGRPFVWQSRNQHDITKDLAGELWGMQNILNVADAIDAVALLQPAEGQSTVIEDAHAIFNSLRSLVPHQTVEAGLAFLEDCAAIW